MRKLTMLALAVCFLGLAASAQEPAADSQTTDAKASKATVYVYRYKQFVGSALSPSVWCDETELARMENGRYFTVTLDPGKHTFHSNDPQSGVALDLKAGQPYFIRLEIATGLMKGHGRLTLVAAEQGTYELKSSKLKPLDQGKVVDKTRVSVEVAVLQTPSPTSNAPAPVVTLKPVAATSTEHVISGETISDPNGALGNASQMGDQVSVGEAARRARDKKQSPPQ
jgi:Protein of unknown function (DUF2846)